MYALALQHQVFPEYSGLSAPTSREKGFPHMPLSRSRRLTQPHSHSTLRQFHLRAEADACRSLSRFFVPVRQEQQDCTMTRSLQCSIPARARNAHTPRPYAANHPHRPEAQRSHSQARAVPLPIPAAPACRLHLEFPVSYHPVFIKTLCHRARVGRRQCILRLHGSPHQ